MAQAPLATARDQFAGAAIGNKIYAFGGNRYPDGFNLKSLEVYDSNAGTWTNATTNENNGGAEVEELTGATVNGKLYVLGALRSTATGPTMIRFVEEYDPASGIWTSKAPMPTMRTGATAAAYGGKVYLFGGSFDNAIGGRTQTPVVEAFDAVTNSWQFVTNMPKALAAPAIAVVGGKAYVFGGGDLATQQFVADVSIYDFTANTWASGGPMPHPRVFSYAGAAPIVGSTVYLVGGIEGTAASFAPSPRVDLYDTATSTWSIGPSLPAGLTGHLTAIANGHLYVVGGNTKEGTDGTSISAAVWSLAVP